MDETVKILCVDDEPIILKALKRVFLDEDYTILTANSAEEGFEILETEHIQIVISDYRMPFLNGVEFLKEVCSRWPETIRIVLSGYADVASIVAAVNMGQIYKFVPKPWNNEELKVTVTNAIERYHLFRKNAELTIELQRKNVELGRLNSELQKLLEEKSTYLDMKSRIIASYQSLLDCIPIGIVGINKEGVITNCNSTWADTVKDGIYPVGQDAREYLPESLIQFSESIQRGSPKQTRSVLNRQKVVVIGNVTKDNNGSKTTILTFLRDESN